MYIVDSRTEEKVEVDIQPVNSRDLKLIRSDPNFIFEWGKYKNKELYKLVVLSDDNIQGLICIVDHTDDFTYAIEIELLEVSNENVGKKKRFDRVAGLLIAFACRESLRRGHEGYMFLTPKTALIKHYIEKYHFLFTGPIGNNPVGLMVAEERIARKLIKEYLE